MNKIMKMERQAYNAMLAYTALVAVLFFSGTVSLLATVPLMYAGATVAGFALFDYTRRLKLQE